MARRKELHDMKAGGPEMETEAGAEFFSGVEPHMETLNNFVRHIIVSAESNGDLPKGELDPEDLVTETLLRAHEEFTHRRPKDRSIRNWLMRLALKQLEVEIDRIRKERSQAIDIEGDVPETYRPEEAEALGDELVDFYEPDEEFNVEEILPEIEVPSPEQEMETREFRRCVREALNAMRADWRQAVFLRYVLGMSGNKLAKFIKKPVKEVPQILEDARAELRRLLTESGCVFGEITRASD